MKSISFVASLRSLTFVLCLVSLSAFGALKCPAPPEQVSHDSKVKVEASVMPLSKLKLGDLNSTVDVTARNVLDGFPEGGRVYIAQLYMSMFCELMNSSPDLSESERFQRFDLLSTRVIALVSNTSDIRSSAATASASESSASPQMRRGAGDAQRTRTDASKTCSASDQALVSARAQLKTCNADLAKVQSASAPAAPSQFIFNYGQNWDPVACKGLFVAAMGKLAPDAAITTDQTTATVKVGSYSIYAICYPDRAIVAVSGPASANAEQYGRMLVSYATSR